jgi:hypothetical protein
VRMCGARGTGRIRRVRAWFMYRAGDDKSQAKIEV